MHMVEKKIGVRDYELVKEMMSNIDFTMLENKVTEVVGVPIELKCEVKEKYFNGQTYDNIIITSVKDVKDYCGFLKSILESVYIKSFGAFIKELKIWDEKLVEELYQKGKYDEIDNIYIKSKGYFLEISMEARYHLVGSNGLHLFYAEYNFQTKEWSFN